MLDVSAGVWRTPEGPSTSFPGEHGSAVMFEPSRILKVGGDSCFDLPTNKAERIDFYAATPTWEPIGNMTSARRDHNLVILPNGRVMAVGGTDEMSQYVHHAEWVDPRDPGPPAPQWSQLAEMTHGRAGHSTAVLLSDGRVLAAGTSSGGPRGEIFSPPYLFQEPQEELRREILSAPAVVNYGSVFTIEVEDLSIDDTMVTLLRLGAVTHGFDQNQRFLELEFQQSQSQFGTSTTYLDVTAPADSNLAPRGYYMLFFVDASVYPEGIPSKAAYILLQ